MPRHILCHYYSLIPSFEPHLVRSAGKIRFSAHIIEVMAALVQMIPHLALGVEDPFAFAALKVWSWANGGSLDFRNLICRGFEVAVVTWNIFGCFQVSLDPADCSVGGASRDDRP